MAPWRGRRQAAPGAARRDCYPLPGARAQRRRGTAPRRAARPSKHLTMWHNPTPWGGTCRTGCAAPRPAQAPPLSVRRLRVAVTRLCAQMRVNLLVVQLLRHFAVRKRLVLVQCAAPGQARPAQHVAAWRGQACAAPRRVRVHATAARRAGRPSACQDAPFGGVVRVLCGQRQHAAPLAAVRALHPRLRHAAALPCAPCGATARRDGEEELF
jgi:hypothetical protein